MGEEAGASRFLHLMGVSVEALNRFEGEIPPHDLLHVGLGFPVGRDALEPGYRARPGVIRGQCQTPVAKLVHHLLQLTCACLDIHGVRQ